MDFRLPVGVVYVWQAARTSARREWQDILDDGERSRLAALRKEEDRDRFLTGCAVVRTVVGRYLSVAPRDVVLDRRCPDCGRPHGQIRVPGLHVSVSHSGDWVLVAAGRDGPVGVDVEMLDAALDVATLAPHTLSPGERRVLSTFPDDERLAAFVRYWCRKESVVKVTGEGLRHDLTGVRVAGPREPPTLHAWSDRPGWMGRMFLRDLAVDQRHLACVAYESPTELLVEMFYAAELFAR